MRKILTLAAVAGLASGATACGAGAEGGAEPGAPNVVVTTNILGDVVSSAFGDLVEVEVIMPAGADPHEFAASAKQATAMEDADLLVLNGAGFEAGLQGVIDSVTNGGTTVFAFADHMELLSGNSHDQDEEHADEELGPNDPHLWTDPVRVAAALTVLGEQVGALAGVDAETAGERAAAYVGALDDLDAEIVDLLAPVPAEGRIIVTNHEVFGYFADRYEFTLAGAVVPSLTTKSESSAQELEALVEVLRAQTVRVIFAETTQSTQLAEALAAQVGSEVEIVELFTESLGEAGSGADTYLGMMRTNAQLIADSLVGSE